MRYLMLVRGDADAEARVLEEDTTGAGIGEMDRSKVRMPRRRLTGAENAVPVHRRKGKALVTDGPFPETKEGVAGLDLLEE
jgi:hypothetical protein